MKTIQKSSFTVLNFVTATTAIVLIAGFVWLIKYSIHSMHYEETNDAQVESYINPVSARVGGYIHEVRFNEQQFVRKGDTLVVLENQEYQVKVNEAAAVLEDAYAQIKVLETSIDAASMGTVVNKNQIASSKARLWQQEQDNVRYKKLLDQEAVSGQEFEQVKTRYDVAKNDYLASLNSFKGNSLKVEELKDRRALIVADIKRKQAILDYAKINLGYTIITSPFTGQTGRKTILEGQQIQPGQPLVSIVNEKQKWVTANFKETQVTEMHTGQHVEIIVDALPDQVFHGKIDAVSASTGSKFSLLPTDNSTGNFVKIIQRIPVKIVFTDTNIDKIKTGMNVSISIKNEH